MQPQPFGGREFLLSFLVFAFAALLRAGYVFTCVQDLSQPPPLQVQDSQTAITVIRGLSPDAIPVTDHDQLVKNLSGSNRFASTAPLADQELTTAHISPGYVSLVGYLWRWVGNSNPATQIIIWLQCVLGAITASLYFLFARLAFGSTLVGLLAGLLAAINPFWIINATELQDGTLASFLVACCLLFGTAAAQRGSPLASFLFGGSLAGITLVRAALLPFSFVACLWVLLHFRKLPRGWLCALLVFLGFGNGLAPWTVRNYQEFGTVVPIVDSVFVHLWVGNNSAANGGPQDESALRTALTGERLAALLAEKNQAQRYRMLAEDVWAGVKSDPAGTIEKRLRSGACFIFGAAWLGDSQSLSSNNSSEMPAWAAKTLQVALPTSLLVMLVFGVPGWRWAYGSRRSSNLASLAIIWIPLPYILSHADAFSGPRLPLDGVLMCYAALALSRFLPSGAKLREETS